MSEDALVTAYTSGRISRRAFVRRLVMRGVPLAAAMGYASALAPGAPSWVPPALRTVAASAATGSTFHHTH